MYEWRRLIQIMVDEIDERIKFQDDEALTLQSLSKKLGYTEFHTTTEFYKAFPDIFHSLSGKSSPLLTWTHYRTLLQENNIEARNWYIQEATEQTWNVRTLQRNISSQYYFRSLKPPNKKPVKAEMNKLTISFQDDKLEFIKNPVVAEFLGLSPNSDFTELVLIRLFYIVQMIRLY
jgi:AraC-like DNA-binding protein